MAANYTNNLYSQYEELLLKILKINSSILTYSKEKVKGNIEFFQSLGYTKSNILEMMKQTPAIIGYQLERLSTRMKYLQKEGFDLSSIRKITSKESSIFRYSDEILEEKLNHFIELGYKREDRWKDKRLRRVWIYKRSNIKNN